MLVSNNKVLKINNKWLNGHAFTPYTIRLKYKQGTTPTFSKGYGVLVDSTNNIWDLTYENPDWGSLLQSHADLIEVIEANTEGVTDMYWMFWGCKSLTSVPLMGAMFYDCWALTNVPLFDTSKVTYMNDMFRDCGSLTTIPLFDTSNVTDMSFMLYGCTSLTNVPLFDTSKVTTMEHMFNGCTSLTNVPLFNTSNVTNMNSMLYRCYSVESGSLALYQQASTQANPPSNHSNTFTNCGRDTTTGAAELAQIPSSWGGTGA